MLCDACSQKEATIHLTQMINNEVKKIHLCEDCAAESGLDVNSPMSITNVLLGLGAQKAEDSESPGKKTCAVCHMRLSDFKKTSRLGCGACYEAFADDIKPLLEGMHKGLQHVGKVPSRKSTGASAVLPSLPALRKALESAIATEQYEEAARLRDQIRRCKEGNG